jgi:ribosome assembly protein 1
MQASPETYGIVYSVINKCRGRVIKEEIQDGTNYFLIDALIPLVEGFVFNEQIHKKSCGIAYPQLVFSHFETNLENDPLFIPKTMEEMEEDGEGDILNENIAKKMIEKVRKQKGMMVSKKILVDAEKQRTLTKNK